MDGVLGDIADAVAGFSFENQYNDFLDVLQYEADGFADVLNTLAGFDVAGSCSGAMGVFTAVGTALTTLFLCMEVFTYCAAIDFNGGIEGAIKVAMKMVVSALIVQNTGNIVGLISGLFKDAADIDFAAAVSGISSAFAASGDSIDGDMGIFGVGYMMPTFMLLIVFLINFVLFSFIVITMAGVVFETGILTAVSPVAVSTLVNSTARSTGISFIKNFAAVSMQWGVIAVILQVYSSVGSGLTLDFASAGSSGGGILVHVMTFATPVLSLLVLATAVKGASEITKRALGG